MAVNVCVKVSVWTCAFICHERIPRSGLLSQMVTLFNFLNNCQSVFQTRCTIFHSSQHTVRVPISPSPYQYLLLSISFTIAILVRVKCYFIVGFYLHFPNDFPKGFPVAQTLNTAACNAGSLSLSQSREDPLEKEMEKEMATHYSILAWRIPWREEPGRLQPMGSQRVGHN